MNDKNRGIANLLIQTIKDVELGKINDKNQIKESLKRFKHERLIHLIVTVFVGLFLAILLASNNNSLLMIILKFVMIILEGSYLYHYYRLENGVQKLNQLYIKLISKKKN